MGICASCLGRAKEDVSDTESTRLLDEDLYGSGYNYGAAHTQRTSDVNDSKREQDALDAICQRTSDSVIDIWTIQSQTGMTTMRSNATSATASSSRVPSNERTYTATPPLLPQQPAQKVDESPLSPILSTSFRDRFVRPSSPVPGELVGMKYVACSDTRRIPKPATAPPKHWGEVVMTNRSKKKKRPGIIKTNKDGTVADNLFKPLVVD